MDNIVAGNITLAEIIAARASDPGTVNNIRDVCTERFGVRRENHDPLNVAWNTARRLVCIDGMPGTGKTHLLANMIVKLILQNQRVVVLTPNQESSFAIRQKTHKFWKKQNLPFEQVAIDVKLFNQADVVNMYNVLVVFTVIEEVSVCRHFGPSVCIIDDASNVWENQELPVEFSETRLVMAGDSRRPDPYQGHQNDGNVRPLSVMSTIALRKSEYSYVMLEFQLRCHKDIVHWSNQYFYDAKIKNLFTKPLHPDKARHMRKDVRNLHDPFVFIATSLENENRRHLTFERKIDFGDENFSYDNIGEANIVMDYYKHLISRHTEPENIAIITEFPGQAYLISKMMRKFCKEEDREKYWSTRIALPYQVRGSEFDVVIYSMVRNNPKGDMGPVEDLHRLNFVITRAKKQFMLIGSGFMLHENRQEKIKSLFDHLNGKSRRFHPNILRGGNGDAPARVWDNFGDDFEDFMNYNNDPEMLEFCQNSVLEKREMEEKKKKQMGSSIRENVVT